MKKKVQPPTLRFLTKRQKILFWLGGSLGALIILTASCYHFAYWHKIFPGVTVVGYQVGNQTIAQASKNIESLIANSQDYLEIKTDKQKWDINLKQINFSYNPAATVQKAYQVGRQGQIFENAQTKVKSWLKGTDIGMVYSLNQDLLESQLSTITAQIYIPAIEPTIKIADVASTPEKSRIQIEAGKDGQELDKRKLLATINYQLTNLKFDSIQLPLIHISPTLTSEQVENTRQRAEKLLTKKLILVAGENRWELKENDLVDFLSFTNGFDRDKIASWSANLASTINRPPENATFQFSGGKVIEFRPAQDGKDLDQKKTIDLVTQNLNQLEQGEQELTINLSIISTPPKIKTADVNDLGIKELIGKGLSHFRGSIPSRIHNIQLASSRLNGTLIPPGETFSFNKALGDVSQSTGYQEAYIIKEGRTILGDGGGVCQVSTTLFRASLNTGLPIIERRAHAYRVGYYEQNSDVGLDATVFDPTADLKIQNDTPAHILIQTIFNPQSSSLTFELYGTSDGRKAVISKSRIWDQIPPPPDLYQDDPTLPLGTVKQIDWKAWGAKVAFDYKVERNGEILQSRTFYSNYQPWQAIFLKGPVKI